MSSERPRFCLLSVFGALPLMETRFDHAEPDFHQQQQDKDKNRFCAAAGF